MSEARDDPEHVQVPADPESTDLEGATHERTMTEVVPNENGSENLVQQQNSTGTDGEETDLSRVMELLKSRPKVPWPEDHVSVIASEELLPTGETSQGHIETPYVPVMVADVPPNEQDLVGVEENRQHAPSSHEPNPPGTKAKRKRASPHQVALLNQIYEYTTFPSTELRKVIGKELGMAPRTVQIWFQNRRQAWKLQKVRNQQDDVPKVKPVDNERGGWEVLRSFQARRANGEIQEYEYMSIPSPQNGGTSVPRLGIDGLPLVPFYPGMMQVALSSNDQFNSSMQQLPMPMPHTPRPNAFDNHAQHQADMSARQQISASSESVPTPIPQEADVITEAT